MGTKTRLKPKQRKLLDRVVDRLRNDFDPFWYITFYDPESINDIFKSKSFSLYKQDHFLASVQIADVIDGLEEIMEDNEYVTDGKDILNSLRTGWMHVTIIKMKKTEYPLFGKFEKI